MKLFDWFDCNWKILAFSPILFPLGVVALSIGALFYPILIKQDLSRHFSQRKCHKEGHNWQIGGWHPIIPLHPKYSAARIISCKRCGLSKTEAIAKSPNQ